MSKSNDLSTPPRGIVLAAVAADELTEAVARAGYGLAKAFQMELRLVSVLDPVPYDLVAFDAPNYLVYPPVNLEMEERLARERELELQALLANLGGEIHKSACVITGAVGPSLISEALTRRANLIITGYSPEAHKLGTGGFETALTLMHDAPLPVLAVSVNQPFDARQSGLRLMLADDLQEPTREAACKAYELAAQLPGCHLRHVHVHHAHGLLQTWRELLGPASKGGQPTRSAQQEDIQPEALAAISARRERLARQGQPYRQAAEKAGVQIETDLRSGRVHEELKAAVADYSPDLLIFGRHRLVRTRPFLIGQMPFRTMLNSGCSVLIVPPREELYAKLPFPA